MICLQAPPTVRALSDPCHRLSLSLCGGLDTAGGLRETLTRLLGQAGVDGTLRLRPPQHVEQEDVVEGQLAWQGETLDVYFQWSVNRLDFSSASRPVLEQLAAVVALHSQIGVPGDTP